MIRVLLAIAAILHVSSAFSPMSTVSVTSRTVSFSWRTNMVDESSEESATATATSLEEKMKSWEASEEEIKAATLGGVVPGGSSEGGRTDAFDVGLYIAFPFMVISCLAFVFFPLIVGNIDVTSVGPPPTS